MKKKLHFFGIITVLFITLFSCDKETVVEPSQLVVLKNTIKLDNPILIDKLKSQINTSKVSSRINSTLNLSSATISEYEGSNAQCITIPVSKNLTYATYSVADKLIDVELFIEIIKSDNIYTVKYYDLDKNEIGGLSVNNGIVYNAYGIIESGSSSRLNRFGSRWGRCVGTNLNRMTDGSVGGSIYGLACMVFGPQCAGGVAAGCALSALM